jgi:hypothetical protein
MRDVKNWTEEEGCVLSLNDRCELALDTLLHHCSVSEDRDSAGT